MPASRARTTVLPSGVVGKTKSYYYYYKLLLITRTGPQCAEMPTAKRLCLRSSQVQQTMQVELWPRRTRITNSIRIVAPTIRIVKLNEYHNLNLKYEEMQLNLGFLDIS